MKNDIDLLRHIVKYCNEIDETVEHFGDSFEMLQSSSPYKNATAMCVFQIGELSGHLSDDFKTANDTIGNLRKPPPRRRTVFFPPDVVGRTR
jgi:uncharacterized protein with HEPN domain